MRNVERGAAVPDRKGKVGADSGWFPEGQCQRRRGVARPAYFSSGIFHSIMA
jgi:hypothetical protein